MIPELLVTPISLGLSIICYASAKALYDKLNKNVLLHPMLIASIVLITSVAILGIPATDFLEGNTLLTYMIAPVSIGLMVPLAEQFSQVKKNFIPILLTLTIGSAFTLGVTLGIAALLGVSTDSLLGLSTKSVTTPVALAISGTTGALPSLSALIVIITGVFGVITAPLAFRLAKTKSPQAKGLALGLSAHIIGSTHAIEEAKQSKDNTGAEYAAFSVLAMGLVALISALSLPWLVPLFIR